IARGAHGEAIAKNGLQVDSHWDSFNVRASVTDNPSTVGVVDLVLHCTKLYSNTEALPLLGRMVGPDTNILTIQNGVTSGSMIAEHYGWDRVLQGATYIEAGMPGPGRVHQSGSAARIEFGENDGSTTARTAAIRDLFDKPGIQVEVSSNIVDSLWSKLVSVASIGTTMTAARATLPEVLASPRGEASIRTVMEEIVAVGQSQGVNFPPRCAAVKLEGAKAEADAYQSSLQYDLEAGKPLELDELLGAVVSIASEADIPVPASAMLVTVLDKFKHGS
ncbi:MAG: 2-dehydropantoate 2-reductase, partial [Dehalococcoidia bacterium]|nr:2-dehydropantoate 2-reductase [Dehalococcoidia bacterium]